MKDYCGQRKAESRTAAFFKIMKSKLISIIFTAALLSSAESGSAQGFVNLDFESANIPSSTPTVSYVPIGTSLPGWNAYFISSSTTNQQTEIMYDALSLGGNTISIVDTNVGYGVNPIHGNYSVFLYGGGSGPFYTAQISQSGLVPSGTESLQLEAQDYGPYFIVTLGGQTITMSPLQVFPNYTLYGGNIPPSLAGQVATLSITEPPPLHFVPSELHLDNIVFSPNSIPEPSELALAALGSLFLGFRCRRR
jgi:hypothetical protein